MPSYYNKNSEVATNKLLQLLRDKEHQEDDTVFVPPDPIDKPVKSTTSSDTREAEDISSVTTSDISTDDSEKISSDDSGVSTSAKMKLLDDSTEDKIAPLKRGDFEMAFDDEPPAPLPESEPSAPAIDKPTEKSVDKDVTDTDPDLPVDFESIIEEKYIESQDQIDRSETIEDEADTKSNLIVESTVNPKLSPAVSDSPVDIQEMIVGSIAGDLASDPGELESVAEDVSETVSEPQLDTEETESDGIPDFDIIPVEPAKLETELESKADSEVVSGLSAAEMIFQEFSLESSSDDDATTELLPESEATTPVVESTEELVETEEITIPSDASILTESEPEPANEQQASAVDAPDTLDLIFKEFADENDVPPEETETDTDESDIPVIAETTKVDTEDDLDLLFNDDNTDTEIIDAADSSEKRTETDDVSQESVEKPELTFEPVDLPIADDIEEAEIETPQKAPDQEETISVEEEEITVEAQELTAPVVEEDFEDDFDAESSEPVTFIYKKEKKFSKDFLLKKFKSSKGRLGLDIGSYAIKYIDAQEAGGVTTINDFGYIKIPTEVRADVPATQKFVKSTIKEILSTNQNKKSKLNLLLNGHDVSIKSIHMPKVGKKELKEAVRWSTRKQLSFEADEANLDYKVINDLVEDGIPKLDILVVAAHNTLIDKSIDLLSNIKIPAKLTLVPLAAWRAFMSHYPTETAENVMVLDVGHSSTMINVVNKGNLRFAREVGIAGRDFTESLMGSLNTNTGERIQIDADKAEELKHKYGLPHGSQESLVTEDGITLEQLSSRIRAPLEKLGNEIQRSMQYYAKEFPYGAVEKIYLCGGSSIMQNLDIFLTETLNHDVIVFDPTSLWNYGSNIADLGSLRNNANSLAIPAGIALDTSAELNLLPEKLAQETQNILLKFLVKSFTILVILAILSTSTLSVLTKSSRETEIEGLEQKLSQLSPSHKNYNRLLEIKKDKTSKLNSLRSLYNKPAVAVQIFKIFSNLIPDHITLNTMVISEPSNKPVKANIDCSGYLLSSAYNAKVELAKFIMELDNSGYIKANSINLKNSYPFENKNRTGMYFEIEFDIINNEN